MTLYSARRIWKVMESRLQVHLSIVLLSNSRTGVKFVSGDCSSKMLISSGQGQGPGLSRNKRTAALEAISNQPHSWNKATPGWLAKISFSDTRVKGATSDCLFIYLHTWEHIQKAYPHPPPHTHFLQICAVLNCWPPKLVCHLLPPFFSYFYTSASIGSMFVFRTL